MCLCGCVMARCACTGACTGACSWIDLNRLCDQARSIMLSSLIDHAARAWPGSRVKSACWVSFIALRGRFMGRRNRAGPRPLMSIEAAATESGEVPNGSCLAGFCIISCGDLATS